MANTRTSTKRARQAIKRQKRNVIVKGATKSAVRNAITTIKSQDAKMTQEAYMQAVRALSKAASKGSIPKQRAARKISRLTRLVKKTVPAALPAAK